MFTIDFLPTDAMGLKQTVGPIPYFRINGPELRIGPHNRPVARHENYQWQHEGNGHTVMRISSPVQVRFEGHRGSEFGHPGSAHDRRSYAAGHPGSAFGLFQKLEFRNGYMYADEGLNLAYYDNLVGQWFVPLENRHFLSVVVETTQDW